MTRRRAVAILVACLAFFGMSVDCDVRAQIADEERVLGFVTEVGDQVVDILSDPAVANDVRVERLIVVLDSAIDLEILGRAVLARHWRAATDEQREEYLELFRQLAVAQLSDVLSSYSFSGETYEIEKVVNLRKDKLWSVYSKIVRPGKSDVYVQWIVLKKKSGELVLFDVKAEEFSLVNTRRDEFGAVVSRRGMDGLIEELRIQTEELAGS
jgi:phospholipid transport system substrate-binding protein